MDIAPSDPPPQVPPPPPPQRRNDEIPPANFGQFSPLLTLEKKKRWFLAPTPYIFAFSTFR